MTHDLLDPAEAFDRSRDSLIRHTLQAAKVIAVTPSRHDLSLHVFSMIKTVVVVRDRRMDR